MLLGMLYHLVIVCSFAPFPNIGEPALPPPQDFKGNVSTLSWKLNVFKPHISWTLLTGP